MATPQHVQHIRDTFSEVGLKRVLETGEKYNELAERANQFALSSAETCTACANALVEFYYTGVREAQLIRDITEELRTLVVELERMCAPDRFPFAIRKAVFDLFGKRVPEIMENAREIVEFVTAQIASLSLSSTPGRSWRQPSAADFASIKTFITIRLTLQAKGMPHEPANRVARDCVVWTMITGSFKASHPKGDVHDQQVNRLADNFANAHVDGEGGTIEFADAASALVVISLGELADATKFRQLWKQFVDLASLLNATCGESHGREIKHSLLKYSTQYRTLNARAVQLYSTEVMDSGL